MIRLGRILFEMPRQARDRPMFKDRRERKIDTHRDAKSFQHLQRQQRVSAKLEKIVLGSNPVVV